MSEWFGRLQVVVIVIYVIGLGARGIWIFDNWYYKGQREEHERRARNLIPQIKTIVEQQGSAGLDVWIQGFGNAAMLTDVLALAGKSCEATGQIKEAQILLEHSCRLRQKIADKRMSCDWRPSLAAVYGRAGKLGGAGALYGALIMDNPGPRGLKFWTDWAKAAIENNKTGDACRILKEGALTCKTKGLNYTGWKTSKEFLEHTVDFMHTEGRDGDALIIQKQLTVLAAHEPAQDSDD